MPAAKRKPSAKTVLISGGLAPHRVSMQGARLKAPAVEPETRTAIRRLPDGTTVKVTTTGHVNKWDKYGSGVRVRTCKICKAKIKKVRGSTDEWVAAEKRG